MAKRGKKSEKQLQIEKEYRAARSRVVRYRSNLTRRGYIPTYNIPSIPKKITKASIRALQKFTADYALAHSIGSDPRTGEVLSGTKAAKLRRSIAATKAAATRRKNRESFESYFGAYEPSQSDITAYNWERSSAVQNVYDVLREIYSELESPDKKQWYGRSQKSRFLSTQLTNNMKAKIQSILSEPKNTKKASAWINSIGGSSALMASIEATLYGYGEDEIDLGYDAAMGMIDSWFDY